ncbi:DUF6308 family protein [Paenarthrobacter sp. YJN-5]|uniref:DUF6308 family protein n=1 Tax=Paenarthrobacter sp. YJN-5 TaxID=2735316 RepID=UPI001877A6BA|nr:DUF6308 family protein [Paenarthrobacter sp. YJN-5]QOT17933.1 hypothetical protein HMI59_15860 [Paenarthrobacter sp. YJN-5]
MTLPDILSADRTNEAAALLKKYYTKLYDLGVPQSGSRFDDWAGGGDRPNAVDTLTADDVLAVSFLCVQVPAQAVIGLLERSAKEVSELLAQIPSALDLASVKTEEYEALLGPESAAIGLWRLLRGNGKLWGIGPTTASKIMARKRPRLIPIFDSVVGPLMGHTTPEGQWKTWHSVLTDGSGLQQRLRSIKTESGIDKDISELRTMDVVLWMHGKEQGMKVIEDSGHDDLAN